MIKYIAQLNLLNNAFCKVNLFIDNRNISVIYQHDLEVHLNLEFIAKKIAFKISYKDSSENLEIRLADLISYSIFQHYNKINSKLENFKDKLNEVQCRFP